MSIKDLMFSEWLGGSGEITIRAALKEADSVIPHYGFTYPLCRNSELMFMVIRDS